jgi:hypothetical protein
MSLSILDRLTAESEFDGTPDVRGARGRLTRGPARAGRLASLDEGAELYRLAAPAGSNEERGKSVFEPGFERPNLLLKSIDPALELEELGPKGDLVQLRLHSVQAFLHALQARHQHLVLGLEPIEALIDGVEVTVDPIELGVHFEAQATNQPLDVGHDYLAVELGQNRQREWFVRHGSYPTAAMDVMGPSIPA